MFSVIYTYLKICAECMCMCLETYKKKKKGIEKIQAFNNFTLEVEIVSKEILFILLRFIAWVLTT